MYAGKAHSDLTQDLDNCTTFLCYPNFTFSIELSFLKLIIFLANKHNDQIIENTSPVNVCNYKRNSH